MTARRKSGSRVGLLVALTLLLGLVAAPAQAAPLDAADFAAQCNSTGLITVTGTQIYRGGSGTITGDCAIALAPGATLVLRNVDLTSAGNLAAVSSREGTTIRVANSSIVAAGALELTAGCCAGDATVPERDGTVVVRRSTLVAESLQLVASFDYPNGRVVVRSSSLTATGTAGIQIRASDLGGSDGIIRLVGSALASAGDVLVRTGSGGRTVVRRNTFSVSGAITVSAGAAGSCVTAANTPPVACT